MEIVYVKEYPIFLMAYPKERPPNPYAAPKTKADQNADDGAWDRTVNS